MKKNLKVVLLGIYAGASIALGGFLNILSKSFIENQEIAKIVGSLLFPVGLTLVCYLGMNLFTGKIGYLFDNKKDYVGFLGLVYLGNIIGSLIAGFVLYFCFRNVPKIYDVALGIGNTKTNIYDFLSGMKIFGGAVLCGALVYLAVLDYKKLPNHFLKVFGIFIPIALFVYLGNDHCIANMSYFTFAFKFGDWKSYLNIALATLGNSIGAIALNEGIKAGIKIFKKENKEE